MDSRLNSQSLKLIAAAVIILLFFSGLVSLMLAGQKRERGRVSISGAWALYPLAVKWREKFEQKYPGIKVDVQAGGAGKGIADVLAGMVDIGMVSREIRQVEIERGAVAIPVARDAVVATVSDKNPLLHLILKKGLSREKIMLAWIKGTANFWEELYEMKGTTPVYVVTRSDACGAAETWAAFLGKNQEDLKGIGVFGDPGMVEAVRNNPYALGYNNINFAYDPKTMKPVAGLQICPLDLNANGIVDPEEDFYGSRSQLVQAIAAEKYPSPPARANYFVVKGKPKKQATVLFINWIMTEGQAYVPEMGYLNVDQKTLARYLELVDGWIKEAR